MKKISKISGVKKLNRNDLKEIKGGSCTQQGRICCERLSLEVSICDVGVCENNFCLFF